MTAYDGSIPQRTEVYATITDNSGQTPKIPHPPIPQLPFPTYPNIPLPPKVTRTTQRTTKVTEQVIEDEIVPDITTTTEDDPSKNDSNAGLENNAISNPENNTNSETDKKPITTSDFPLTVISLVAIGALIVIVAAVILFVCKKGRSRRSTKKEDMVSILYILHNLFLILIFLFVITKWLTLQDGFNNLNKTIQE